MMHNGFRRIALAQGLLPSRNAEPRETEARDEPAMSERGAKTDASEASFQA